MNDHLRQFKKGNYTETDNQTNGKYSCQLFYFLAQVDTKALFFNKLLYQIFLIVKAKYPNRNKET